MLYCIPEFVTVAGRFSRNIPAASASTQTSLPSAYRSLDPSGGRDPRAARSAGAEPVHDCTAAVMAIAVRVSLHAPFSWQTTTLFISFVGSERSCRKSFTVASTESGSFARHTTMIPLHHMTRCVSDALSVSRNTYRPAGRESGVSDRTTVTPALVALNESARACSSRWENGRGFSGGYSETPFA